MSAALGVLWTILAGINTYLYAEEPAPHNAAFGIVAVLIALGHFIDHGGRKR